MPIASSDIWKLKTIIASTISSAINEPVFSNSVTVDFLDEVNTGYRVIGEYETVKPFGQDKKGKYEATLTQDGKIISLKIGDKLVKSA